MTYMNLQEGLSSKETVEAKKAFESYTQTYSVRINHYHTYKVHFADNAFQHAVKQEGQTITYCGVNAHFQNGKAEKRIRYTQEQTRQKLHHAKAIWTSAMQLSL